MTKDFGLVPFNVILLVIAAMEYYRGMKAADVVALEQPRASAKRDRRAA